MQKLTNCFVPKASTIASIVAFRKYSAAANDMFEQDQENGGMSPGTQHRSRFAFVIAKPPG